MAVVFAIYELVDLILLLAAKVVDERVKPMFHALGVTKNWKGMRHRENAIEAMCQVEESTMRRTKINAKGQVTIPAELRERFGIKKGTRIDWKKDGSRLVLTPITRLRKKS
jgi:AbrB family looped-hinge helix DNA binding protein